MMSVLSGAYYGTGSRAGGAVRLGIALAAGLLAGVGAASGQEAGTPALPDAVQAPPDWLKAPFDLAAYFRMPAPERNAAPLYLDALLEFGPEMSICFPEGPERDRRERESDARAKKFQEVYEAFKVDRDGVPDARIDTAIASYKEGFRKVELAQRRPECMFAPGYHIDSLFPHAQTARQVVRVASMRTYRDLERGDFERPMRDLELVLRLSRDLRPRSPAIGQLVAIAIEMVAMADMVRPIVADARLRPQHCGRLRQILEAHASARLDPYEAGLKGEYVIVRYMMRDLITQPARVVDSTIPDFDASRRGPFVETLGKTSNETYLDMVTRVDGVFRGWLGLVGVPAAARAARFPSVEELKRQMGATHPYAQMVTVVLFSPEMLSVSAARAGATLGAWHCLVALRRQELSGKPVDDLAAAVRAAGMLGVPTDPYSGEPLRLALVEGRPAVYSVGSDGKDDRAALEAEHGEGEGDLIIRLPKVGER